MWFPSTRVLTDVSRTLFPDRVGKKGSPAEVLKAVGMDGADIKWQERMDPALLARVLNHAGEALD